jgi:hypothetical protein
VPFGASRPPGRQSLVYRNLQILAGSTCVETLFPGPTPQEVVTSALWDCGSGAPRRRVLRGPCLLSKPPGKKKKKDLLHIS